MRGSTNNFGPTNLLRPILFLSNISKIAESPSFKLIKIFLLKATTYSLNNNSVSEAVCPTQTARITDFVTTDRFDKNTSIL